MIAVVRQIDEVDMELYSHDRYKGYLLFVECYDMQVEDYWLYEGIAQLNGTTIFTSKSIISGANAELQLKAQIDESA